uniref:G-protein coupled receptors family 2 profile 2 domain-containing protein n=1 Tax=Tetranychus urticae TaxID=32264 RepID=T1K3C6_TETUR
MNLVVLVSAFKLSNFDPTSPSQPWSCVDLPISLHGLYAFKQCKPSFRSSEIEHLCISEPKSFLQWLPAFSSSSGIFYRNLFCAFCNLDHDSLHNWNLTITCDHNTSMLDITPYINEKHFNYSTGLWEFIAPDLGNDQYDGLFIDNKWRCKPSLPELEQYDSRSKFGTRSCQPVIDSCSTDWTDPIVASKCSAYTFLVGLPSTKTIYRNTFCARCNYVPQSNLRRLDCDLNKMAGPARSPTSFTYVSLRQLFDVSAYSSCSLTQYQIYNPASQSCMTVRCDVNYTVNPETGRCESITRDKDGTTLRSDCLRIFFESSDYTLNSDGSILLKERLTQLEHGLYQNFTQIDSVTGTKIEGILTCYDEHRLHYSSPMYSNYIQGILSIITSALSILGLTAYLTVTCLVPKLRNLRARMLMCLSGSLLAANVALICGYLARPALNESDDNIVPNTRGSLFCVITAINIHYWYLASFAWMNVMAYDAWKSFKRTHERLSNSMVHFLKYSLYSWLLPASVVLISVSFDLSNIPFDYRPMYGHRICWISQRKSLLAFFVAPVATIIVINVVFFSLTTWFLYRTKQSTRIVVNSKSQENSQRYSLYVRLATLMGLTWIFWFFAAFSGINLLWYLFIILNGLQGAFIFFYFTCKKEVFKALQERIGFLIHGHEVVSGSSSSRATRSASLLPQSSSTTLQ